MKYENKFPIFKKGNIIKKDDLDMLRDNSIEVLKNQYINNCNGILKGFEIEIKENLNKVFIGKGLLKYNDHIYWTNKKMEFLMPEEEDRYIVKLRCSNEIKNRRYYINNLELVVEKGINIGNNEIEIGRFITRIGAELRNDYQNFKDLRRDYNLIEIINTKYSSENESGTVHPKILKLFVNEAKNKNYLENVDITFLLLALNGSVERDTIILYINNKLGLNNKNYTNEEIFYKLQEILEILGEEKTIIEKRKIVPKKITLD